jgi:hypothetical protein
MKRKVEEGYSKEADEFSSHIMIKFQGWALGGCGYLSQSGDSPRN